MKKSIDAYLKTKKIALLGASDKKERWGNTLLNEFEKIGYKVYPINPRIKKIGDRDVYANIDDLPEDVELIISATNNSNTINALSNVSSNKIKSVWLSKKLKTNEEIEEFNKLKSEKKIELIAGPCPLMYINGKGIHKLHQTIHNIFSKEKY